MALGQNKLTRSKNFYLKVNPNYGFIMEHHSYMAHLVTGYVPGVSVDFIKPTYGNKLWQRENNMPDIGLTFNFINFGNPRQLGYCYALAPFMDIPLNKKIKASRVIMRLCWGVSYLNRDFNIETDPKNIAIGSHWNTFVHFKWFWALNVSKRLRLEPGLSFSHASNGRAQVPNLGLNVISANLGITYKFLQEEEKMKPLDDSASVWPSKHEILVWAAGGFNETGFPGGPKYAAYTFGINYYYNKRNTHKFGGGVDICYETQNYVHLENAGHPAKSWMDIVTIGPKFCYSYNVGRISFPVEMGVYAVSKPKEDGLFFHRIGVRHYCKNGLVINFSLKSHWAVASHFEYGLGYRFSVKKRKINEQ
ncbi:MAG: acyloxyacyl hydrolase [Bacteroidetes bacterium]|nr:acyloxyacyl hydrolase [Bacteroidota bacterium]